MKKKNPLIKKIFFTQLCVILSFISIAHSQQGSTSAAADGAPQVAAPLIQFETMRTGSVMVQMGSNTKGAVVHYTMDGTPPTKSSAIFATPFVLDGNYTVKAIAILENTPGEPVSAVSTRTRILNIPTGMLIWSDEFSNETKDFHGTNPYYWVNDVGSGGWGNHELETYCDLGSTKSPCDGDYANSFIAPGGQLHIVARHPVEGAWTSAKLKSKGLVSFHYGRFEIRAKLPEAQGVWPAFWLLGDNIDTVQWPASGEIDVMERVNAAKDPDWNEGSIHGPGYTGKVGLGTVFNFPKGKNAGDWHTYGMIWKPGSIALYVDDYRHPYVTYTPESLKKLSGSRWVFDDGQSFFMVLNVAVGGDWPGAPTSGEDFPAEMIVDYIRVYKDMP